MPKTKNDEVRKAVLKAIKSGEQLKRADIAAKVAVAIPGTEAHKLPLSAMVAEGTLKQHGERGGATYSKVSAEK